MFLTLIGSIACSVLRCDEIRTLSDGTKAGVVKLENVDSNVKTIHLMHNPTPEDVYSWKEMSVYSLNDHKGDDSIRPSPILHDGQAELLLSLPEYLGPNDSIAFRTNVGSHELYTKPWTPKDGSYVPYNIIGQDGVYYPVDDINKIDNKEKQNETSTNKKDSIKGDAGKKGANKKDASKKREKSKNAAPYIFGLSLGAIVVTALFFAC